MTDQIQPAAFHVSLSPDLRIIAASANIGEFLSVAAPTDLLGQPMTALFSATAIHDLRNGMALLRSDSSTDQLFHCKLADSDDRFDVTIYRKGDAFGLDVEAGTRHAGSDSIGMISGMLDRLDRCDDLPSLCRIAASQVRSVLGFDRVAIFIDDALVGESARPGSSIQPPSSPAPADRLAVFERSAPPVALIGESRIFSSRSDFVSPTTAQLDWLATQDAEACFVVPIQSRGRRFGQTCCLHRTRRLAGLERRSIVRLFVAILAMRVEIAELRSGGV